MYQAYYGLTTDPFPKEMEVKNSFKSKDFEQAFSRLEYLKTTKGFGLITGEPGVGKSFLLRNFTASLNPNLYKVVYIPISTLTVSDFYRALCDGLGVNPSFKKVQLFKQIQEAIYTYHSKNVTPVIILDEAQFLKNSVLDDLRIIFNFEMDSKDYSIVILAGQTPFVTQINRQTHEALKQRIMVNYYLKGLSRDETKEYIVSRLKLAGRSDPIFTENAFELIYSSTSGCVRLINSLARLSLNTGASKGLDSIDNEVILEAQGEINITA